MSTRMRGFGLCMETRSDPQPIILTPIDFFVFIYSERDSCVVLQVRNGSKEQPYVNPKAPVHIITGSAVSTSKTTLSLPAFFQSYPC